MCCNVRTWTIIFGRHFGFTDFFIKGFMRLSPNLVGECSVTFATGLSTYGRDFGFPGFLFRTSWTFTWTITLDRHFGFPGFLTVGIMVLSPNLVEVGMFSDVFTLAIIFGRHFGFPGFFLKAVWDVQQTWWGNVM